MNYWTSIFLNTIARKNEVETNMVTFQVRLWNFLFNLFSFFLCPWLIRGDYFFRTVYIGITLSYSRLQMPRWRWRRRRRYLSIALQCIYLPVFMKTNLTKFAAIWVKKGKRAGLLLPISSKITPVKGKKVEKEIARNTLLDWWKRSISKLRLDTYFLSFVRLTQWFWLSILRRYLFERDHLSMVA